MLLPLICVQRCMLHTEICHRHCDAQAVEKEVNERLAIMRPYPEVPVKKLLLWLHFAFVESL